MRIVGLDIGQKRIGVAVSDPLGITAQGVGVIDCRNADEGLQKIAALCRAYQAEKIVAGLPLNMNGSKGPAARETEMFTSALAGVTGLPVVLTDERLTTRIAERTLIDGRVRRKKRKGVKDKLAAVLILENYLASARNTE